MKTAEKAFASIPENSDVLVLRSARQWMIQSIIQAMNQYRKTRVDLVGQRAITEELKFNPGIERVYIYGDGFFSPDTIEPHLIEQLRANTYDYVFLPMANNHLEGYRNVLDVARLIRPKYVFGIYPEGNIRTIQ